MVLIIISAKRNFNFTNFTFTKTIIGYGHVPDGHVMLMWSRDESYFDVKK